LTGGKEFTRISKGACLKMCLKNMKCMSVDYDHRTATSVCHVHIRGEPTTKLVRAIGADHYTMVRLPPDMEVITEQ